MPRGISCVVLNPVKWIVNINHYKYICCQLDTQNHNIPPLTLKGTQYLIIQNTPIPISKVPKVSKLLKTNQRIY